MQPEYAVIVGKGAREHALVWGLKESSRFKEIFAMPGNPGISQIAQCLPYRDTEEIVAWAMDKSPMLVVVGPENPLAEGIVDRLREAGHWVIGPEQRAARLESSKSFAKSVMERYGIPTPRAMRFDNLKALENAISIETQWPHVLKQSGLAGGKGVVIVETPSQALQIAREWSVQDNLLAQGILWEDYLEGKEISVHVLTNGKDYVWLPLTRDYKRATPDLNAPNTGGMGAFGPVTDITPEVRTVINEKILEPLMQFLQDDNLFYHGVLYVGIMLTHLGPMVLEFNVRMGDPEAEVLIPLLPIDWGACWLGLAQGNLPSIVEPESRAAVAVVLADSGYPLEVKGSQEIILPKTPEGLIFHGSTQQSGDGTVLQAQGGRIVTVVGRDSSLLGARDQAYRTIRQIIAPDTQFRHDIAADTE
ncbi:MAG: phosphoribosylamine--glycine ligase [Firmicutes bacterium]|nr:phosphoribosylamine--glycine ligase [Bacillota bacterium]